MVLLVSGSQFFRARHRECVRSYPIIYAMEMFELVENRLYAYADDSTLLAVVRKPADRPALPDSFNRDFPKIQECCNHS